MSNTFWNQQLFPHIKAGATVLTPNRRLSATIHKQYQTYCLQQNNTCWQTPEILPIITWLQKQWQNYSHRNFITSALLLNPAQEQFLWEKVLLQAKESEFLLRTAETADIAKSAWALLNQWQVNIDHNTFNAAEEGAALYLWIKAFQKLCVDKHVIDMNALAELVMTKIETRDIKLPSHIVLVGFTELSPQLNRLVIACRQAHCTVTSPIFAAHTTNCKKIALKDQDAELFTVARWAKTIWQKTPTATIGCVIPSLDKIRDRVMQIFSEVFANDASSAMPFNISAGKPLAQYPVIKAALLLLTLHKSTINSEVFSFLLTSPFLGEADVERIDRAIFDSLLRQKNINLIDIHAVQSLLNQHISLFAKRIQAFKLLYSKQEKTQTFSQWMLVIHQMLTTLGWPGERSLTSEEYQTVENWLKLLNEAKTLDQVTELVSFHQALQTLHKMAGKRLFQPKTEDAPIQVLGILEAAALPFDYLWITGMDDLAWPPQPKPNPLIPKRLQRELGMPHANAERELRYCELLTQQFKQSGEQVIFSHALRNEDLTLQISPLLKSVAEIQFDDLNLPNYQKSSEKIFNSRSIENILDECGPKLTSHDAVRGGVNVLKQQALCPFKAFAEWRLHARELEFQTPGLRAKDRGTVLHKALEIIWNRLQDYKTLITLSEEALTECIEQAIQASLTSLHISHHQQAKYLALEQQRLYKLISDWLALEKTRLPFKIMTNEGTTQISLNALTLSLRIDRIDELADGSKLIIDYKTGKNNDIANWFSDRPEEPQLPLYALIDQQAVAGIAIAQLATGEQGFKGVSREDLSIKGIKLLPQIKKAAALSWEDQIENWRLTLNQLSDDFAKGVAKVDPKDAAQTCLWCALKGFCRITEEVDMDASKSH